MSITSIILTTVSHITVLVSQNIVFFDFVMRMSMVSIWRLLQVLPSTSPLPSFQQVCLLFYKKKGWINLQLFWSCYLRKICIFEENKIFSFSSLLVGFDFAVLLICFLRRFLRFCHYEITNQKLLLYFRFPRKLSLRLILPPYF